MLVTSKSASVLDILREMCTPVDRCFVYVTGNVIYAGIRPDSYTQCMAHAMTGLIASSHTLLVVLILMNV